MVLTNIIVTNWTVEAQVITVIVMPIVHSVLKAFVIGSEVLFHGLWRVKDLVTDVTGVQSLYKSSDQRSTDPFSSVCQYLIRFQQDLLRIVVRNVFFIVSFILSVIHFPLDTWLAVHVAFLEMVDEPDQMTTVLDLVTMGTRVVLCVGVPVFSNNFFRFVINFFVSLQSIFGQEDIVADLATPDEVNNFPNKNI